jgi:hypothetical protein
LFKSVADPFFNHQIRGRPVHTVSVLVYTHTHTYTHKGALTFENLWCCLVDGTWGRLVVCAARLPLLVAQLVAQLVMALVLPLEKHVALNKECTQENQLALNPKCST